MDEKQGTEISLLDVSELLVITDAFVIATGRNRRHILSLSEHVIEVLRDDHERRPIRREGLDDATWVLLDYGDIVVHIFDTDTRAYFDLDRLWGDAPKLVDRVTAEAAEG
ncbi:MAG: ribosome silencing factor [Acidimicrobiia bacterium]|nr:ribosome silencing factor [Acidimicrobiia bacterium]